MRNRFLVVSIVCLVVSAGGQGAAASNESDFTFVSRMPVVEGDLRNTIEGSDAGSGLAVRKRIYVYDHDGFELWTHVIEAACSELAGTVEPIIMALQYFPKEPKSFSVAAMPDLYLEVYARDEHQRVRAYQKLNGRQMAALTDRFMPVCQQL